MSEPEIPKGSKLFPIQLKRVDVGEIHYACSAFSVARIDPISDFELETGLSEVTPDTKIFQISLGFVAKTDPEKTGLDLPYTLVVRVHGQFEVLSDAFPSDKLEKWAHLNGTAVLLPFLRETVHSITAKSGFKPFIMPLIEAPLYRVAPPSVAASKV